MFSTKPIRVLALMESATVTGPAKNLIRFGAVSAGNVRTPVEIVLVTFQRGGGEPSLFVRAARQAGITVIVLQESGRWDTSVIKQLRTAVAEYRPDIVQSHNIKSHFLVRLLGLQKKYPWVAFNHGYTATDLKDRLYNQIDRWSLRAARHVVAVCGPFARRLSERGVPDERIRVQHNSVKPFVAPNAEAIEAVRAATGLGSECVIVIVGRFSYEKGHRDFIDSIALLAKCDGLPPYRAVLVGDGPERELSRRRVAQLGLESKIIFAGFQEDVRPFYAIADLLVAPSHSEGSPNVVLEAMAAGLPVAATNVGGIPEILEHEKTGLLFPPQDPAAMAEAIARLLKDEPGRRRLGDNGRERVATLFTHEAYCNAMITFYKEVLATWAQRAA